MAQGYAERMEILKGLLIVLHIVGFAVVFGSALSQLPAARVGKAFISPGLFHGLNTMFLTGLLLVVMKYSLDEPVNNLKISLKLVVLIVMIVITLMHRKKVGVSGGVFGAIAGLGVLNVVLAVFWQ
jgi:cobalamin synthase